MACYFVARIRIHDEAEYRLYLDQCDEVFARFSGRYLAVDRSPIPLEGTPEAGRMVLIEFPDEESFRSWYDSPEYQTILAHRLAGAHCTSVLVRSQSSYIKIKKLRRKAQFFYVYARESFSSASSTVATKNTRLPLLLS